MGERTGIEWCDSTWNPVRGCSRVSEGCRNCYAERVAARFSGPGLPYDGFADPERAGSKWTGRVEVVWPLIDLPLRWKKPRRIFANSMSDLFHEELPDDEIANIYAVMVAAVHVRGHTFQVLTKRADRMRGLLASERFWDQVNAEAGAHVLDETDPLDRRSGDARATCDDYGSDEPSPGIWLGVSVENQAAADERIPHLLATPAAARFLSCEPLLGPVDLLGMSLPASWGRCDCAQHVPSYDVLNASIYCAGCCEGPEQMDCPKIDWVIAGGESGPGARPMHPDWARSLRDQCAEAGVPFFFKQWGEWLPCPSDGREDGSLNDFGFRPISVIGSQGMWRVGKRAAGSLLDGREHKAFPA